MEKDNKDNTEGYHTMETIVRLLQKLTFYSNYKTKVGI